MGLRRYLYFVGGSLDVLRTLPRPVQHVLHCFQKKSKSGTATAKRDLDLIQRRLKLAIEQDKALSR